MPVRVSLPLPRLDFEKKKKKKSHCIPFAGVEASVTTKKCRGLVFRQHYTRVFMRRESGMQRQLLPNLAKFSEVHTHPARARHMFPGSRLSAPQNKIRPRHHARGIERGPTQAHLGSERWKTVPQENMRLSTFSRVHGKLVVVLAGNMSRFGNKSYFPRSTSRGRGPPPDEKSRLKVSAGISSTFLSTFQKLWRDHLHSHDPTSTCVARGTLCEGEAPARCQTNTRWYHVEIGRFRSCTFLSLLFQRRKMDDVT